MFSLNLDKLNVNEAELKAYIYQQLNDIEAFLGPQPISIKMTSSGKDFIAKMSVSHELGEINAEGTGDTVYAALSKAKEAVIQVLAEMNDSVEPEVRETKIQSILTQKKAALH